MATAPTTELGRLTPPALPGWGAMAPDVNEPNPLFHDRRTQVQTCEQMLTDSQVDALRSVIKLPILARVHGLYPNGAPAAVASRIAEAYGLPILKRRAKGGYELDGEIPNTPSSRGRFNFREHAEVALDGPFLGHYYFEQVYTPPAEAGGKARLRKLAVRPPSAITEVAVDDDGGLAHIRMTYGAAPGGGMPPAIPVDRLVAYVWERRGTNWNGRPMLRSIYREWLLKDRNLRLLAMRNQRAGMGMPVLENAPGTNDAKVRENVVIPQALIAGEDSGVSLANGASLTFQGVQGTLPDILADIKYLDEAMSRRFLAMLVMLGQTQTGSRALGGTFGDWLQLGIDAVDQWFCDTFSSYVIEDDVDWNDGDVDLIPYRPRLAWATPPEDDQQSVTELVGLIRSGAIQIDTEVEDVLRSRHNLPPRATERLLTQPPPPATPAQQELGAALFAGARRPPGGWG